MFEVKPLRWSFLASLPFIVAAIWGVLVVFAGRERSQLIERLTADIRHGSVSEATLAVRKLARMYRPPMEPFVRAAASPSGLVADEAQAAIGELLRAWQWRASTGNDSREIAGQLRHLAAALEQRRDTFSTDDFPWLESTAVRIVRLANRTESDDTTAIATCCDTLLAMTLAPVERIQFDTPTLGLDTVELPSVVSEAVGLMATAPSHDRSTEAARSAPPAPATERSEIRFVGNHPLPSTAAIATQGSALAGPESALFDPPTEAALETIFANDEPPQPAASSEDAGEDAGTGAPQAPATSWNGPWVRAMLSHVGVAPVLTPVTIGEPAGRHPADTTTSEPRGPAEVAPTDGDAASSRSLLERWLTADQPTADAIERRLHRRGFGVIPPEFVWAMFSDTTADRVELVQQVISVPGVDAKPWLMLLADDPSAEVRLSALGVMTTSSDPDLLDKAWQTALHDQDPRVSRLAPRIRDRRASLRRH